MNDSDLWLISPDQAGDLRAMYDLIATGNAPKEPHQEMQDTSFIAQDIGVLRIHGLIQSRPSMFSSIFGLNTTEQLMEEFDALERESVPILLDIDTHGGNAGLAFEFADMIANASVPVWSYSGGMAASLGYLYHSAAHHSVAHETAMIGSIGVAVSVFKDQNGEPYGSQHRMVSANAKNKKGSTKEIQRQIDQVEGVFLDFVSSRTGLSNEEVVKAGNSGGLNLGSIASERNLIDETSNFKSTLTAFSEETMSKTKDTKTQATPPAASQAPAGPVEATAETQSLDAEQVAADINARWPALLAVGAPMEMTQSIALNNAIPTDQGVELLTAFKAELDAKAPAQEEPAGDPPKEDTPPATLEDKIAGLNSGQRNSILHEVNKLMDAPNVPDNARDVLDKDAPESKSTTKKSAVLEGFDTTLATGLPGVALVEKQQ